MAKEVQDLPHEGDIYLQRENCTEDQVNTLIKLGYTPWQVTPVTTETVRGSLRIIESKLVYHFIRRSKKS
jgi:hypothetical protein